MSQRVLITGATGFLGRQVTLAFDRAGYEAVGTGFSRASPPKILKLDIQDESEVAQVLDEVKPRVVVHCAADRQPDSCTKNPDAARKLNVTATANIATLCGARDIFLVYISTDYVFPGRPGEAPYNAQSTPAPTNVYGTTKLEGEKAVLANTTHGVVLRVPVLYGETEPKDHYAESAVNVIVEALWKAKNGQHVKMDDWAIRYPTNTADIGRVCVDVAKLYTSPATVTGAGDRELPRILAFTSEDKMTKYQIMTTLNEIMAFNLDTVVADKDGGKPGPDGTVRPYDCHLSTAELKSLGIDISTVDFTAWWKRYLGAYRH